MNNKSFGIVNPKKIDYMFSVLSVMIAVAFLWVGIWITATKTYQNAMLVFDMFGKAIKFDLADLNYWSILVQSVSVYAGFASALALLVMGISKRKFRTITGAVGVGIAGIVISVEIGFVALYANQLVSEVVGVFAIVLAILCLATILFAYKMAKHTCKLIVCDELYKKEFEDSKNGLLKDGEKKIQSLSKSQEVYDAVIAKKGKKDVEEPKKQTEKSQPKQEQRKPETEPIEKVDNEESPFGIKANHYTFEQKLKMAKPVARKYFKEIKEYFEELGFKSTLTKSGETFIYKNTKFAVITTAGKSGLKVYFKLSPANYEDSTLPYQDVSDKKKYEKTPLLFVVKSDLAVRRAKALMDDIKKEIENE